MRSVPAIASAFDAVKSTRGARAPVGPAPPRRPSSSTRWPRPPTWPRARPGASPHHGVRTRCFRPRVVLAFASAARNPPSEYPRGTPRRGRDPSSTTAQPPARDRAASPSTVETRRRRRPTRSGGGRRADASGRAPPANPRGARDVLEKTTAVSRSASFVSTSFWGSMSCADRIRTARRAANCETAAQRRRLLRESPVLTQRAALSRALPARRTRGLCLFVVGSAGFLLSLGTAWAWRAPRGKSAATHPHVARFLLARRSWKRCAARFWRGFWVLGPTPRRATSPEKRKKTL